MGKVVRFRAGTLDNPPTVQAARAFLEKLRGRAYRYAYRVYAHVTGKGPKPRGSSGSRELDQAIARAVGAAGGSSGSVARFAGFQERPGGKPPLELYHLTRDIPGHPRGSTVARETIERAGFTLPPRRNLPSWLDTPGAGITDPEGGSTAKCHRCGDTMTEAETLAGPVCRSCARAILEDDSAKRRNPMSRAARKAYPSIAKMQDELARAALRGGQAAVDAYLRRDLYRGPRAMRVPRRRRNPLPPCSYCGGPGGFVAGPDHSTGCLFYRKPRRVVRTISRRRPRNPGSGGWLYVNGVQYEIVAKDHDRQGELLMIRKPKGRKLFIARRRAPGDARGYIVFTMPGRGPATNPPRVPSNATLIYPKGRFDPGTTWRGTHRSGGRYYHKFRSDTDKAMYGLPGGGIAFIPKRGRLWGYR